MSESKVNRRTVLKNITLGAGAMSIAGIGLAKQSNEKDKNISHSSGTGLKGNINHSVCKWCYQGIPLQQFTERAKEMGIKAIDLLKPNEWKTVQNLGLECALATADFVSITDGFNNPKNHNSLQKQYRKLISEAAHVGIKQVIVFSGNRNGISDEAGWEQCARGLEPLVKHAEKNNITLIMELLNSKVNHKDYQCDTTPWGVALANKIGSSNFKLLYDIYHMQIMEGDIIATIRKYKDYIGHYHTGGVPGRNEINQTQELQYPAIMKAIIATGFKGYVAQEFIPTYTDKLKALKEGITICDV